MQTQTYRSPPACPRYSTSFLPPCETASLLLSLNPALAGRNNRIFLESVEADQSSFADRLADQAGSSGWLQAQFPSEQPPGIASPTFGFRPCPGRPPQPAAVFHGTQPEMSSTLQSIRRTSTAGSPEPYV